MIEHADHILRRRRRRALTGVWASTAMLTALTGLWIGSISYRIELGTKLLSSLLTCSSGAFHLYVARQDGTATELESIYMSTAPCDFAIDRIAEHERSWLWPKLWQRDGHGTVWLSRVPLDRCVMYSCAIWVFMPPFVVLLRLSLLAWRHTVRRGQRCVLCDYSLRENMSGVCPECGTPFRDRHEIRLE
jgi:hypothetical protein